MIRSLLSNILEFLVVWHMLMCHSRIGKIWMQRVNRMCSLATVMKVKHIEFTTPKLRNHLFDWMLFFRSVKCMESSKNAL